MALGSREVFLKIAGDEIMQSGSFHAVPATADLPPANSFWPSGRSDTHSVVRSSIPSGTGGMWPGGSGGQRDRSHYVQIMGLLVATLVTKVVVPVLYVLFVEDFRLITWSAPGEHAAEGPPAEYLRPDRGATGHHPHPAVVDGHSLVGAS